MIIELLVAGFVVFIGLWITGALAGWSEDKFTPDEN